MRRYPKYKDSGEWWFGEIPDHWVRKRVKHTSKITYGDSLKEEDRKDGGFPVYGSNGIVGSHDISFTVGETIIIGRKGSYGKINWSGQSCFPIDTTFYIDKRNTTNHLRWLFYVLGQLQLDSFTKDSSVPGINREEIYERYLICPPLPEQYQIVDFLDQKTSVIDELIGKKLQKIELLKEHRTTIINHTVTKGLNPYVKMKDSGVDWIGEIPEHWGVTKPKYETLKPVRYGLNIGSDTYKDEGVRFIRITDITESGELSDIDSPKYLNRIDIPNDFLLDKYDILLCRSGHTVGKSYFHQVDGEYTSGGYLVRFNFGNYNLSKYFIYITKSDFYWDWIKLNTIVSTIENVNGEKYSNFDFPFPPPSEQHQIVEYLDQKTNEIDTSITLENKKIDLLKEYRQILISEVVTGKIDVRKN